MANFTDRVSNYPLVSSSLKAAFDAYNWVASEERFRSIFQITENAAAALKEKAVSLASTDAVSKLDEMACHQILDRLEAVFPSVKKPTEELLGPAADRALDVAESYLENFFPDTKIDFEGKAVATRYDRLMRLQSALVNSEKVQAAQGKISSAYKGIQEQISALSTVATTERRDTLLCTIYSLAAEYKKAAEIAFPRFKTFVAGAVSQLQSLSQDLRQKENVTQVAVAQLQATLNGLHSTLLSLNELREKWFRGNTEPEPSEAKAESDKKD